MKTTVVHVNDPAGWDTYIGRTNTRYRLAGSPFQNPYRIGKDGTREEVIALYREYLLNSPDLLARLHELRGKRLSCWCKPAHACHGDVLAALADREEETHG